MGPEPVVEPEIVCQSPLSFQDSGVGLQVHLLILHSPPQPLHEDVVLVPPLPSMLIRTPRSCRTGVNWLPWSVLNSSGCPWSGPPPAPRRRSPPPWCWTDARPARTGCASPSPPPGRGHGQVGDVHRPHLRLRGGWLCCTSRSRCGAGLGLCCRSPSPMRARYCTFAICWSRDCLRKSRPTWQSGGSGSGIEPSRTQPSLGPCRPPRTLPVSGTLRFAR